MKADHGTSQSNSNGHNKENKDKECNGGSLPFGQLSSSHVGSIVSIGSPALPTPAGSGSLLLGNSLASIGNNIANSDCLESLLRNIEGLVAIAVHNARQQQNQLNMHKGKLLHFKNCLTFFLFYFERVAMDFVFNLFSLTHPHTKSSFLF